MYKQIKRGDGQLHSLVTAGHVVHVVSWPTHLPSLAVGEIASVTPARPASHSRTARPRLSRPCPSYRPAYRRLAP
jgi:hypothetical protein